MHTPVPSQAHHLNRFAVLIVEDNKTIRETLMATLTALGVQHFWVVPTVEEGIEVLDEQVVHMVISDCDLAHDKQGIAFLKTVERDRPTIYRLLISGNHLNFEGFKGHTMAKPFGIPELRFHLVAAQTQAQLRKPVEP